MDDKLLHRVLDDTDGFDLVVEYGCASGEYVGQCRVKERWGVDIMLPGEKLRDVTYVDSDMRTASALVPDGGVAILIDSIEHLPKEDGLVLLEALKEKHKRLIVYTPEGYWKQNEQAQEAIRSNPYQEHLSGWDLADFDGWDVERITDVGPAPSSLYAIWDGDPA